MGFCPSDWRDILCALSSDMIWKAWPCATWLSVNQGDRLRVSQMNHISRIEKRVELLRDDGNSPITRQGLSSGKMDLDVCRIEKVCHHDSMILGSRHVLLGAATD